ncbi:ABC transporter permease [Microbacterium terricola]|uniref:Transport permease protein n=1 Tax=Microbacterium terricola TaxID=344163 RepID=A0ABM8DWI2_9MICO|nr:ABC transporter permease [Microbacterium terricola]UYK39252.1 ABC transporter permease [Microbacterium terricola]BDV30028.1 transport permease protein [Microbacterium terricola]
MTTLDTSAFETPGRGRGLLDVFRYRYLLRLLIGKTTSLRYRNSALGWFWSYVRPTVQFLVYYLIVGQVMGMHRNVESFPLYLFSGIVVVNLFNEAFGAATGSIVSNKALVRKIYLPRELFPIAAIVGAFIHFLPQLAILLVVSTLVFGYIPSIASIGLVIGALALVLGFIMGIGLFFSAINVRYRDASNVVEIIRTIATWSSPILYTWIMVYDITENVRWLFNLYMANPITVAVEMFHHAFWEPAVSATDRHGWPPDMVWHVASAVGIAVFALIVGQYVFRRSERTFAQDL